ncbi:hypothetical protein ACFORJ_12645 [Corynebacterium hansenii]|uniref:Uncharacterized protein n=1 Tax=Corynebacterium hansenii TaxID=394964 RepID=A0ABV7ZS84_9CORY|nr:hypothetical protein [Corynebacterium hansenii]WJY99717.1 hypothetical protein CHAN_05490 [Corynebacterium hansenii]
MTRYRTITRALFDPEDLPSIGERIVAELAALNLTIVKNRVAMPLAGEDAAVDAQAESLMDRWLSMNSQPPTIEKLHALLFVTEGPAGLGDEITAAIGRGLGDSTPWTGETIVLGDGEDE